MTQKELSSKISQTLARSSKPGTLAGLKQTDVATVLEGMKLQIVQALPKHLTADRMIQMAASLVVKNPKIASCTTSSLVGAVMQASILGFRPVESLGQCYFVPYGNLVQFQIGYRGYISLAQRSGKIKMIYAEVVYEGDDFKWELGLEPVLTHKPCGNIPKGADKGDGITHAYAVAHYKEGGFNFIVLPKSHIEKLRLTSPMQKGAPVGTWAIWYAEMAKAKAIKQLAKYLPLSDEEQQTFESDEKVIKPENFISNQSGELDIDTLDEAEEVVEQPEEVNNEIIIQP
jgi:recombination protein RecT